MKKVLFSFIVSMFIFSSTNIGFSVEQHDISESVIEAQKNVGIDDFANVALEKEHESISTNIGVDKIDIESNNSEVEISSLDGYGNLIINDSNVSSLEIEKGMAVFKSDENNFVDYAVVPSSEGNIRIHSILENNLSSERFKYTFEGVEDILIDDETGNVFLFRSKNGEYELVGGLDKPWAVDANGKEVPTYFEVENNSVIQVVEHRSGNFAYPIVADPSWWDNVKNWFKNSGSYVVNKAKSAAAWLGRNSRWLAGKTWSGLKTGGKFIAKKATPFALVLCAGGGGWAWYRSDARGWVRVGDAVMGCFL